MFAEALQKGLAAGGWVIGLLASLGGFLALVILLIVLLTYLSRGSKENK